MITEIILTHSDIQMLLEIRDTTQMKIIFNGRLHFWVRDGEIQVYKIDKSVVSDFHKFDNKGTEWVAHLRSRLV